MNMICFCFTQGKVAYVSQQAWIQNTTLENNILFNQPKVDDHYKACLQGCALESDLAILPGGDQTEIGEKVNTFNVIIYYR